MIDLEKEGTYSKGKRKGQERIALGIKDEITFSKYGNSDDIWLSRSEIYFHLTSIQFLR